MKMKKNDKKIKTSHFNNTSKCYKIIGKRKKIDINQNENMVDKLTNKKSTEKNLTNYSPQNFRNNC